MSEERIAELERRVADLERRSVAPKTVTPSPTFRVQAHNGCVCPAGAEQNCGGSFCPRRSHKLSLTVTSADIS